MRCRARQEQTFEAALVTGASSGIGEAIARTLPAATDLLLAGRDGDALAALKGELAADGRRVEIVIADLAERTGVDAVIAAADAMAIDLLVNNAGLGRWGRHLANPVEAEAATVRVNIEAPTRLCRSLLPGMLGRAASSGRRAGLVNLASTAGFTPVPHLAVYAASKAYVISYTEALQAELAAEPVDILLACPGAVATAFGKRAGFAGGRVPGAISPEQAARRILGGLGQQDVVFTDCLGAAGLGPLTSLRGLGARGLAVGLNFVAGVESLRRRGRGAA